MSILSPFVKSPFNDVFYPAVTNQWGKGPCKEIEMKTLDCLEAYGMARGMKECENLLRDFDECVFKRKQFQRIMAMRMERHRQHFAGERTGADKYTKEPPLNDSY
ncbi:unnamed protein product [Ceutorhynchus assimilis]|uniref:Complex I-15 kDa n=1 Tax=Ceutorhynchus assimilis TaxID=467358 RepID=A0A9N9MSU2_9CUCU|nr:unnamed protein product [Ceutorhynchus assimilis]